MTDRRLNLLIAGFCCCALAGIAMEWIARNLWGY